MGNIIRFIIKQKLIAQLDNEKFMFVYSVHTHANKDIYELGMRHMEIYLMIDIY